MNLSNHSKLLDAANVPGFSYGINLILSSIAFWLTAVALPKIGDSFIHAGLCGRDLGKKCDENGKQPLIAGLCGTDLGKGLSGVVTPVPEAVGVVVGAIYLITLFLFIPFPFLKHLAGPFEEFPHEEFVVFIAALLSICCMIFLGFADDVLELKWRHKLLLPTIASLPLLMVYFINYNHTFILIPKPFRPMIGDHLDLGLLYYVYMGLMAVFCTNAINILAGINGLEAGQSLVIAFSVMTFNIIQIACGPAPNESHGFSLYLLIPYVAVTLPLYYYNCYPASVFVGDTFCYFSGMTFAVVAICGHFSKTMLLFFTPQIFNFLYSVPQLFRFIPCPRHRLPRFEPASGLMHTSVASFKKSSQGLVCRLVVSVLGRICLLKVRVTVKDNEEWLEINNMTLINLCIITFGPMKECNLNRLLMGLQVVGSILGFCIRFQLAKIFYDV